MRKEIIGNATNIYALCDESGVVRYVGKTVQSIDKRLAQHRSAASHKRTYMEKARG